MSAGHTLWMSRLMPEDWACAVQVGPLQIWLRRWQDEFYYASQRVAASVHCLPPDTKPADVAWNRWVCGSRAEMVCQLKPALPPRPVIVKPAMPLQVMPGETVNLFVSIPVWVGVYLAMQASGNAVELIEEPTEILSNSWFGLPTEGDLCYALKTTARRRIEDLRPDPHFAICPLTIRNDAAKTLRFDRLCLRLQVLSLYAGASHLWTNHGTLHYRGAETMDGLRFDKEPPRWDSAGLLLAGPRAIDHRGGMQRAFDSIKTIGSLWGGDL